MFLKLLLFVVIGILIYRALGGNVPIFDSEKNSEETSAGDTLVECATCGTYVTVKESIVVKGKHYCSKECLPD